MNTTDNITLLRGDCLEILPTIADCSCDMALVDLPYGCLNKGIKACRSCDPDNRM